MRARSVTTIYREIETDRESKRDRKSMYVCMYICREIEREREREKRERGREGGKTDRQREGERCIEKEGGEEGRARWTRDSMEVLRECVQDDAKGRVLRTRSGLALVIGPCSSEHTN